MDPVERARASTDGWWFESALATFQFLEESFGYELRSVEHHFRGHSISYSRPEQDFVLEFRSEEELLSAEFWVAGRSPSPNVINVENLLAVRDPQWAGVKRRDDYAGVRWWAEASMESWARGLQTYAPDVVSGRTTGDIPWTS